VKQALQLILILILSALPCAGQEIVDGFAARTFNNAGRRMPYRLFIPENYDKAQKYPLVLWLHGAGGAGSDNLKQIQDDQIDGTHLWTNYENQERFPAFVVVPQGSGTWTASGRTVLSTQLSTVVALLEALQMEFNIDANRLYVAGQSDGAFGVWTLITQKPQLFAAAIAVCGGGNPAYAGRVQHMPLWIFHGERDGAVPVDESRRMVDAVKRAGGNPRYTEYRTIGHDAWKRAFAEKGLADWLFSQHK
jgi:predicted peptidase